jgi:serine/threonine-protein kinase
MPTMQRIGEYLVRRLVGEGGMGKVYEAEERLSRRRVALKVLKPELSASERGREMFLTEMTILAHLDHPNIVRCLSCSESDGDLVMALEFLDGVTLRHALGERGRVPWVEVVDVAVQVASALRAAHGQQPPIIHRDLKPENLMLVGDGRVKVMDFGIAKVLQAMRNSTTHSVGTLQYMSPEQIDAASVDARSDLYCLGLVLYEMLGGRPPFSSESPRELLNQQCTAPPPPLPDDVRAQLPRGVERTILRMLEKSPGARPQSAEEVLAALEPFATASPTAERAAVASVALPSVSQTDARPRETGPAAGAAHAVRSDTIALVEQASRARDVPTRTALAIALALSVLAGLGTYAWRSAARDTRDRAPRADVGVRSELPREVTKAER